MSKSIRLQLAVGLASLLLAVVWLGLGQLTVIAAPGDPPDLSLSKSITPAVALPGDTTTGILSNPLAPGTSANTAEIIDIGWMDDLDMTDNRPNVGISIPVAEVNGSYYSTLQDAIDAAVDSDTIKVVGGALPDTPVTRAGLTQIGYITKSITIEGGYDSSFTTVDFNNPSILDAGGTGRGLVVSGTIEVELTNLTLIGGDAAQGGSGTSFDNQGGGLAIDLATVTLNNTDIGDNTASGGGGGVRVGSALVITNSSIISNNTTAGNGGGVYVDGVITSSLLITDGGQIISNTAAAFGGGVYITGTGVLTQAAGTIIGYNRAAAGGGVYVDDSAGLWMSGQIIHNTAITSGGGLYASQDLLITGTLNVISNTAGLNGGGVIVIGSAQVSGDAHFENNLAVGGNGGGLNAGGDLVVTGKLDVISNTSVVFNGGGVHLTGGATVGGDARFERNVAGGGAGGGIRLNDDFVVAGTLEVISNTANSYGGGVYVGFSAGAGVQVGGDAHFESNRALTNDGGGLYVGQGDLVVLGQTNIINNTADGDGGGVYLDDGGASLSGNTLIERNVAGGGSGGGLHVSQNLVVTGTLEVISNTGASNGAVVALAAQINGDARFENNQALGGNGGGLNVANDLVVTGTLEVISNTAALQGGGLCSTSGGASVGGDAHFERNVAGGGAGGGIRLNDDFVVEGTLEVISNTANSSGGGVYVGFSAVVGVQVGGDAHFESNRALTNDGGGLYVGKGDLVVLGQANVISNTAGDAGGGVYLDDGGASLGGNTLIERNVAGGGSGGGMSLGGDLVVTGTLDVISNTGASNGAVVALAAQINGDARFENNQALGGNGGGLNVANDLVVTGTLEVISNTAALQGGGLCSTSGGASVGGDAHFERNVAGGGVGGGIRLNDDFVVEGTLEVISNTANSSGGGVYVGSSTVVGVQVGGDAHFESNRALTNDGGGLYVGNGGLVVLGQTNVISNTASGAGGGVYLDDGGASLSGNTLIERNVAGGSSGGGMNLSNDLVVTGTLEVISNTGASNGAVVALAAQINGDARFENNRALGGNGGGLNVVNGLVVTGTLDVISNTATRSGGGVYGLSGGANVGGDARFERNVAFGGAGGGIRLNDDFVVIGTLEVISNTANSSGGGVYIGSSAVVGVQVGGDAHFESNRALTNDGGGLYVGKGDLVVLGQANVISNTADDDGGGVYLNNGDVGLTGARFENNRAGSSGSGGGLNVSGNVILTNTEFINNTAGSYGGGLYHLGGGSDNGRLVNNLFARNAAGTSGAGLYLGSSGRVEIVHTDVVSPTQGGAQAIYVNQGTVLVTNTIIASYTTGLERVGGTVTEDYSLFFGNTIHLSGTISSGSNSITGLDPAFTDPSSDDYHLTADSAAINAGVNAGVITDFDGDTRPGGGGFDIGYDETTYFIDLVMTKSVAPSTAAPGEAIAYTLVFSNAGSVTASGVVITDTVPVSVTNTSVISSGVAITQTAPGYAWEVQDLAPGEGGIITITGQLSNSLSDGTVVTNTATIACQDNEISLANNSSDAVAAVGENHIYLPLILRGY